MVPSPAIRTLAKLLGLLAGIFWLLVTPSHAADAWAIHELSVLADAHGSESIQTVSLPDRAADFRPVPAGFSAGFTRSVHWLRFTLHAPPQNAKGQREIFLEIHPPYLDDLQIYLSQPEENGAFEIRHAGDLRPHSAKEYPYRAFVFRVEFADASARTAYVRLQTSSSSVMAIKAWEPSHFVAQASREYALLGLLVGGLVAALAANIWQGLWRHEALYSRFIAYMAAALANISTVNGVVGEFLFPDNPFMADQCVSLGVLGLIFFGARFYMLALDIYSAPAWMRWTYQIQIAAVLVCLPITLLGFYTEAAKVLLPLVSLTLVIGTLRSVQLWQQKNSNGKILLFAHLLSLAGNLSIIPTLMGLFPGKFQLLYSFQFGPFGSLLALQFMLSQRMRTIEVQLHQATLGTEIAKATAQQERAEREHQRHFLSMLTHELKTPLSVIRMRLGAKDPTVRMQAHAAQAVQDIDAIVERCAMVSQMEEKADTLQSAPCHMGELLSEVLAQQAAAHRVSLQLAPEALAAPQHSDPILLRTVLSNLIDNALKYSPPTGTVHIHLALALATPDTSAGLQLQIENPAGAAGVPEPDHIFEKYYRAPGANRQSGSGLGLYIVKALVERLGGSIACRSHAGLVIFTLWLPL